MWTDGQKKCRFSVNKSKRNAISLVYPYAPNLFLPRFQFFGMHGRMKWISPEILFLFLGFLLNVLRQAAVASHKLRGENNPHDARLLPLAKLAQRTNFAHAPCLVILFRPINAL